MAVTVGTSRSAAWARWASTRARNASGAETDVKTTRGSSTSTSRRPVTPR